MSISGISSLFIFGKKQKKGGGESSQKIVEKAQIEAKEIILKAKEEALEIEKRAEELVKKHTQEILELEKQLQHKIARYEQLNIQLTQEKEKLNKQEMEIRTQKELILQKLEKISQLKKEEAKQLILKAWEDKLKAEIAQRIREAEDEIKRTADGKAKEILVDAMRYGAVDYVPEYTLSTITLPSDDYKGRIIGKEGRNIRAFELATGVDVDLEEEGVIKISSFDAVKREIARVSLERLIKDGRIQPPRIEEIVKKTKNDIDKEMLKAGEDLCHQVGVHSLPLEIVSLLGKFKFRFSYGQNMILHTLEETKIGVAIANGIGADVMTVRLGCLLHDIGKVVSDKEGSHVQLGVEILKKHGIHRNVTHTVEAHHEDTPFESIEAVVVYIADAVSGGRPGARHEDFEEYLKRIRSIEDIATKHKGVKEAYALQAGRELRVIVRPDEISDDEATVMAKKIQEQVEEKFPTFPGQVNITIIRETRAHAVTHS